jgi:hypothetical protein
MVEGRSAIRTPSPTRSRVEWDATAPVRPSGQLPFFIDYLKQPGCSTPSPTFAPFLVQKRKTRGILRVCKMADKLWC